jgi:hypothetical protein
MLPETIDCTRRAALNRLSSEFCHRLAVSHAGKKYERFLPEIPLS